MEIHKIEMCLRRFPYFDNFSICFVLFFCFLFQFCSATRPLADPCFLKLTCAHALLEVVKIVVNWWDPCFIHLRSPEQFEKK